MTSRLVSTHRCELGRENGDREKHSAGRIDVKNETGGKDLLEDRH
jgi:hypothetical protein